MEEEEGVVVLQWRGRQRSLRSDPVLGGVEDDRRYMEAARVDQEQSERLRALVGAVRGGMMCWGCSREAALRAQACTGGHGAAPEASVDGTRPATGCPRGGPRGCQDSVESTRGNRPPSTRAFMVTKKQRSGNANQHDKRHENGLAAPGKRITKQKSIPQLNGHANGGPHPPSPPLANRVDGGVTQPASTAELAHGPSALAQHHMAAAASARAADERARAGSDVSLDGLEACRG
ncbi:hypothetical protein K505DRAFT_343783, partial [Melanomma pulvis-pyrius CBS 109.77]